MYLSKSLLLVVFLPAANIKGHIQVEMLGGVSDPSSLGVGRFRFVRKSPGSLSLTRAAEGRQTAGGEHSLDQGTACFGGIGLQVSGTLAPPGQSGPDVRAANKPGAASPAQ